MASAKRLENEDFVLYRERLKSEASELKEYLKGRLVWCSSILVKHPKDDSRLVKVKAQGTYKKGDK